MSKEDIKIDLVYAGLNKEETTDFSLRWDETNLTQLEFDVTEIDPKARAEWLEDNTLETLWPTIENKMKVLFGTQCLPELSDKASWISVLTEVQHGYDVTIVPRPGLFETLWESEDTLERIETVLSYGEKNKTKNQLISAIQTEQRDLLREALGHRVELELTDTTSSLKEPERTVDAQYTAPEVAPNPLITLFKEQLSPERWLQLHQDLSLRTRLILGRNPAEFTSGQLIRLGEAYIEALSNESGSNARQLICDQFDDPAAVSDFETTYLLTKMITLNSITQAISELEVLRQATIGSNEKMTAEEITTNIHAIGTLTTVLSALIKISEKWSADAEEFTEFYETIEKEIQSLSQALEAAFIDIGVMRKRVAMFNNTRKIDYSLKPTHHTLLKLASLACDIDLKLKRKGLFIAQIMSTGIKVSNSNDPDLTKLIERISPPTKAKAFALPPLQKQNAPNRILPQNLSGFGKQK